MTTQYRPNRTKAALLRGETIAVPEINRVFDPIVVEIGCRSRIHPRVDRYGTLAPQFSRAVEYDSGGANRRP